MLHHVCRIRFGVQLWSPEEAKMECDDLETVGALGGDLRRINEIRFV